jgi:hypothetical protein
LNGNNTKNNGIKSGELMMYVKICDEEQDRVVVRTLLETMEHPEDFNPKELKAMVRTLKLFMPHRDFERFRESNQYAEVQEAL